MPIDVIAIDETNTRVTPEGHRAPHRATMAVSASSASSACSRTNFPARCDIARPLREAGVQVVIGGFHVSGCLAMLKELRADIKEAQELGISIFAGEAEEGLDEVMLDAARGELHPLYNHMKDLPDIGDVAAPPFLPATSSSAPSVT